MADEFSVRGSHYGIHSAEAGGGGGELIQERDHRLFIGDGHVDSVPVSVFQKAFHIFRFFLEQFIGIIRQNAMDLRGITVTQLSAQKAAYLLAVHDTTSE